jgi:hypothetical protein
MAIGGYERDPFDPSVEPLASSEIYDPTTNTWTAAAPHPVAAGSRSILV